MRRTIFTLIPLVLVPVMGCSGSDDAGSATDEIRCTNNSACTMDQLCVSGICREPERPGCDPGLDLVCDDDSCSCNPIETPDAGCDLTCTPTGECPGGGVCNEGVCECPPSPTCGTDQELVCDPPTHDICLNCVPCECVDIEPPTGLTWYATCGDPVCQIDGHRESSLPPCGAGVGEGASCSDAGTLCDPGHDCNSHFICAATDPTAGPVGCPISRARFKKEIHYLTTEQVRDTHAELMAIRLATYRYRAADDRTHLGFIMEDVEPSLTVDSERGVVDLYAYTSMAVAALQSQNQRIAELEYQLRKLK